MEPTNNEFWGKLKTDKETGRIISRLPLAHHCIDVSAVFRHLSELPSIRKRLDAAAGTTLTPVQLDRLAALALLHDLGKANLGFQDKVFDSTAPRAGHVLELAPLFLEADLGEQVAEALDLGTLFTWFSEPAVLQGFLYASWSHHGRPVRFDAAETTGNYYLAKKHWWRSDGSRNPLTMIGQLMDWARQAFPRAFSDQAQPIPRTPQLQHRFAGLVMLADWLGSHEAFFPIDNTTNDRIALANSRAPEMLRTVGLNALAYQNALAKARPGFDKTFGFAPRPLQRVLDQLPADNPSHRLLIAEAETGSGKTEAALARFVRLFAAAAVDGLYFALPTRVAARELYHRVLSTVERIFPDPEHRPLVLLAVPGYAMVDGQNADKIMPDPNLLWDDEKAQRGRERAWAAERPKRFLAATIAVGTIDQALLSALQTPHAHLRSVCLDRQMLVVDEVHASDPYMRQLLTALLEHHLGLGGHALLLSATLGAAARVQFQNCLIPGRAVPDLDDAVRAPYPALSTGSGAGVPVRATVRKPKSVEVFVSRNLDTPWAMLRPIAETLAKGGRVLVVLNTVDRVLNLQRAAEEDPEIPDAAFFRCEQVVSPHHGRFAAADRQLLDAAVSGRLGKQSDPGPLLLIGTQTLEQSLDIDADLLVTDLCPMDVLLQRIGRLHRHDRARPAGLESACCLLLTPNAGDDLESLLSPTGEASGAARKAGLGSVYPDLRVLHLTLAYLNANPRTEIPRDNRRLVEMATHPDRLASLSGERWRKHALLLEGSNIAQAVRADHVALKRCYQLPFGEFSFSDINEEVRTRLGMNTLRLPLTFPLRSPFGPMLDEILIPGHMAPDGTDLEVHDLCEQPEGFSFRLGSKAYRYTRHGLEYIDESSD